VPGEIVAQSFAHTLVEEDAHSCLGRQQLLSFFQCGAQYSTLFRHVSLPVPRQNHHSSNVTAAKIRGRPEFWRTTGNGELAIAELVIGSIFGAIYYRRLFRSAPLTEQFGKDLVAQVFRGLKTQSKRGARPKFEIFPPHNST
jgi:hypothetical protein